MNLPERQGVHRGLSASRPSPASQGEEGISERHLFPFTQSLDGFELNAAPRSLGKRQAAGLRSAGPPGLQTPQALAGEPDPGFVLLPTPFTKTKPLPHGKICTP